ncbi:hypothetical protein BDV25DRAFT_154233 [Aspergillus avenaceus]|uniref:Uncharacterized protein n=1 Tax=Aspergillus avenaceus TaxID=36643 RepID=A0A5N6TVW1_ASPAV|nr:hypothetical protein BDV25DRAFT_154233 [Aspergillus avenaceus]
MLPENNTIIKYICFSSYYNQQPILHELTQIPSPLTSLRAYTNVNWLVVGSFF